ncbi:class II aminotransferase/8-amino-7-oxononanoate synthase [Aspergillus heteromorphus CBS 117.55]|uniref:Class II aminotransferase/8-amino-7-oxononanoate synthase n=1 Tax=Aspergillus heteromorphus CBS 117.55 TaxID=1448321 RepID=A0A317VT28_9EURO|nr:class II aminotransferase/8-amino-7-oxononanoate synthase [Aspergillus heteromorphus CBS 117.55]PWY77075.1 class II aminotransferase/8-amino-7-oxononanoate synthase [Aspergillus heteromorphus CBS 117.55]
MSTGQDILSQRLYSALDRRRTEGRLYVPASPEEVSGTVDFGSNDTLGLSSSGILTQAFLHQLERHPNFTVGCTTTRVFEGNRQYIVDIERDLAQFHGADDALFFPSGYDANMALWSSITNDKDFVVFDELVHSSIREGMKLGRAKSVPFRHNDCFSLQRVLEDVRDNNAEIAEGQNLVFIPLESIYSMDGDTAPLPEIIRVVYETLPRGNYVLSIDEAHSNGIIGPHGSGMICQYGLEREFPLRLHTCGKALGSAGAVILCNETIKQGLINYARNFIFTTGPTFVSVAAVRAGYEMVLSEEGQERRSRLEQNVWYFYWTLTRHPQWEDIKRRGILYVPTEKTWYTNPIKSPIIPIVTQPGHANNLCERLRQAKYWVNAVEFPSVPPEKGRVRLMVHADNTREQMDGVIQVIMRWAVERAEPGEVMAKM